MKRLRFLALVLVLAAVVPLSSVCSAYADGPESPTATPAPSYDYTTFLSGESEVVAEESLTSVLVGVVWKLGLVVLLAYGVLWVVKRFSVRRVPTGGQQLQVLETVGLGANRSLHVVRVGPQILLIGATAQELRTLADLSSSYDTDDSWGEAEVTDVSGETPASGEAPARTLMPSLEAVERVRNLWRRGQS